MKRKKLKTLYQKYPPSEPCGCEICLSYCRRPGWWTVKEAEKALREGLGAKMMLEVAPEFTFAVLVPAFKGCERNFALQEFARFGCCFLKNGSCELYETELMPLECRFCHHDRPGLGIKCHTEIEKDWNSTSGKALVNMWLKTIV